MNILDSLETARIQEIHAENETAEVKSYLESIDSQETFTKGDHILLETGDYHEDKTLVRAKEAINMDELQFRFCRIQRIKLWSIPEKAKEFFKWMVQKKYVQEIPHKEVSI